MFFISAFIFILFTYLSRFFFRCVLASFHQSNFSDLVFTFFLFRFPFLFFYLSLFLLYFYYNSSQDCESLLSFCILCSNSLPSKILCLVGMKWGVAKWQDLLLLPAEVVNKGHSHPRSNLMCNRTVIMGITKQPVT